VKALDRLEKILELRKKEDRRKFFHQWLAEHVRVYSAHSAVPEDRAEEIFPKAKEQMAAQIGLKAAGVAGKFDKVSKKNVVIIRGQLYVIREVEMN
jgi:nicotinamide mononucleotide (NMN) deamidase PncC